MSSIRRSLEAAALAGALALAGAPAVAQTSAYGGPYPFGKPATAEEIKAWDNAIRADGRGLPPGQGTYARGKTLYAEQCAVCHGDKLQGANHGMPMPAGQDLAFVGGRGSLNSTRPITTVESYWPYATTLFDYIRRAMPYPAPGTLKDDEVYSLVAYILAEGKIVDQNATMDASSLPKVQMPNRNGFYPDDRPEPVNYD